MNQLFKQIEKYSETYEFSFQFWGRDNNNVWIYRGGVELFSSGNHETIEDCVKEAIKYIKRVNKK